MLNIDRRVRSLAHLASAKAHSSLNRRGKHCALIIDKDYNVVASFVNEGTVHAEQGVINKIMSGDVPCDEDRGYTLLVVRAVTSTGEIKLSKPCENCANAIKSCSMIRSVIFSCDHGQFGTM